MGLASPENAVRAVPSSKVWTALITNSGGYLTGLIVLDYTLKQVKSKYPLVALYTDAFPQEGIAALKARGIAMKRVEYLLPSQEKDYSSNPRFYDCWSKIAPFSLVEYERVVQLDTDMFVLKNMDELMDLDLDPPEMKGQGKRVFAAGHACVCNPLKKPSYPKDWIPESCAFTKQHDRPDEAQTHGALATDSIGFPNGGLQVVNPSTEVYNLMVQQLARPEATAKYEFADQSMLQDIFYNRWVTLPYIYNALKTLRWPDVHGPIWRDEQVKNVHMILSPKAWDEEPGKTTDITHEWWQKINQERLADEKARGIDDGF